MQNEFPARFMSIREIAKTGFLPESALRQLAAQKLLPGFFSGRKFLVNTTLLSAMAEDPKSIFNQGKGNG